MGTAGLVGWYGKLPSLGDFGSRRLPYEFIEPWDRWLSTGLAKLQGDPGWLERYLASPTWRFLLMPDVVGPRTWCGILMPSVDVVGRYYPLTLATALESPPSEVDAPLQWAWLKQLEQVALSALDNEWMPEKLEEELERIGSVPHSERLVCATAELAWHAHLHGKSCWYAAPAPGPVRCLVSQALDSQTLPAALFSPGI